jgi:hypothetical protein
MVVFARCPDLNTVHGKDQTDAANGLGGERKDAFN